jgi:hypothetical protein
MVLAALFPLLLLSRLGHGQEGKAKPTAPAESDRDQLYYGVKLCQECHAQDPDKVPGGPFVCLMNECIRWEEKDKHKHAYAALKDKRGQQMGKLLGFDVTADEKCISCHAIVAPAKYRDESFTLGDGVSCVACHGARGKWINLHGAPVGRRTWRQLSREQKESEYGMTDLWNPAKRSNKCDSCHIGSKEENKFVTHDMYAAGHPPLPSIEVATFSNEMPRHWEYIAEKIPVRQKLLHFEPGSVHFEQSKLVAAGAVVALRDSLDLLRVQAEECAAASESRALGLDFANFDCYACHHDLKSPSWRQRRGYLGHPGRPQMRPWPVSLAKAVLQVVGKDQQKNQEFETGLGALARAFSEQPFGNCASIATASKGLESLLTRTAGSDSMATPGFDEASVKELLRSLCAVGLDAIPDYDSARQIAWALKIIYSEWKGPESQDAEVRKILDTMTGALRLKLPAGPKNDITKELPQALETVYDYNPKTFQANLRKLSQLLSQEK